MTTSINIVDYPEGLVPRYIPGTRYAYSGEDLQTIIDSASAGTVIRLAPGTYDLGATTLDVADGITLEGAGKHETILLRSNAPAPPDVTVVLGDGCELRNLTVQVDVENGSAGYAIGCDASATARVTNCRLTGKDDVIFLTEDSTTLTVTDSDLESTFDCIATTDGNDITVTCRRCTLTATYDAVNNPTVYAQQGYSYKAGTGHVIKFYDCDFNIVNTGDDCDKAVGIDVQANVFASNTFEAHRCTFSSAVTTPNDGVIHDIAGSINSETNVIYAHCVGTNTDGSVNTSGFTTDVSAAVKAAAYTEAFTRPTNVAGTPVIDATSSYPEPFEAYTLQLKVYAYKTVGETTTYSYESVASAEVTIPEGTDIYRVDWTWDAVADATGYVLALSYPDSALNYNTWVTVATNSYSDDFTGWATTPAPDLPLEPGVNSVFVDSADGLLKVRFANGDIQTITVS